MATQGKSVTFVAFFYIERPHRDSSLRKVVVAHFSSLIPEYFAPDDTQVNPRTRCILPDCLGDLGRRRGCCLVRLPSSLIDSGRPGSGLSII